MDALVGDTDRLAYGDHRALWIGYSTEGGISEMGDGIWNDGQESIGLRMGRLYLHIAID